MTDGGARDALLRAIGPRVCHVTPRSNDPGIRAHGLRSAAMLAADCGRQPDDIVLRADRRVLHRPDVSTVQLNHQLPILHGRAAADRVVDGYDARGWARQLDERIFLWPGRRGAAFGGSIAKDTDTVTLWLDTARLIDRMADHLWLAPFNTGNFRQGGAKAGRGDWIYCRLTDGIESFRTNRQDRGLVASRDTVAEISLTAPVPADMLEVLRVG